MFNLKDINPREVEQKEPKAKSSYVSRTYAKIVNMIPARQLFAIKDRAGKTARTAGQILVAIFTALNGLTRYMLTFLHIKIRTKILPFIAGIWLTITAKAPVVQKMEQRIIHIYRVTSFYFGRFINFVTKKEDEGRNAVIQATRAPVLFGVYVIAVFVIGGGLWSALAPLHSAAIAPGIIIPDTNKKTIQSLEGGVVKEIFVKQGDNVREGDRLVEFEGVRAKPQYEASLNQYRALLANGARLVAERDNLDNVVFPQFLTNDVHVPEVAKIIHTQENLFCSKREVLRAETKSLKQKILQMQQQIKGYEAKKISLNKTLELLAKRLQSARQLLTKGFIQSDKVLEMEAQEAQYISELAVADTEIAKFYQEITGSNIEILNLQTKNLTQTLHELKETQVQLGNAREQFLSAKDALKRIVLTSPVDGIVHTMYHFTIGGIVNPAYPIMEILPANDRLVIEARVPSKNIDAVHVGLSARIKFEAFKSRTTLLFTGKVISVSPDVVQPQGNVPMEPYYNAKIEIDMDNFNRVAKTQKLELHPGMQAEVQIITGTRTLLRYIFDPILDTMFKAYKE